MNKITFPIRYLPKKLTKKDKNAQYKMLMKSKTLYKKQKYYTRKKVPSYKNKKSNHIENARKIYNINNISPNKELALKSGCKLEVLQKMDFGDGRSRYEINETSTPHHHHHLICLGCGKVKEFEDDLLETLETTIASKSNFMIVDHQVKFYGYCQECKVNHEEESKKV